MAKYSIIVPAYNEEKSLHLFYDAVTPIFESLQEEYEIIFINVSKRAVFPVTLGNKRRSFAA